MRPTYDPERQELVVSLRAVINLAKRAKGTFGGPKRYRPHKPDVEGKTC